ncbi:four helix bundle protein [Ruminococcus sp.]|nr:four helix bundle protein [Ruminococcus sp.]MEE1261519.1 four helix bundle protein [Ruminococcus sp.]
MDLVSEVYSLTKLLPKEELFALSNQMRRAAIFCSFKYCGRSAANGSA